MYRKHQYSKKKIIFPSGQVGWIFQEKSGVIMHNMRSYVLWRRENVLAAQNMK